MADFQNLRCRKCNRFLGKMNLLDASSERAFSLQVLLYCNNRKCDLARSKTNGENVFVISPKK
jgi:hypothetical protein